MLVRTEWEKTKQPALHVFKLQIQLQVTFLCPTIQTSFKCVTSSLAISISFDIRVSPMIGDYILGLVPLHNCVAKLFSSTFRLLQCEQMSCNTAINIMIGNY